MTPDDTTHHPMTDNAGETATAIKIILAIVVLLVLWAGSVVLWGIPGLYLPAVALTAVIYIVLVLLSRG